MKYEQKTKLRTPDAWSEYFGIQVMDPDGWNRAASNWQEEWNRPLTKAEFLSRADVSTSRPVDKERAKCYYNRRNSDFTTSLAKGLTLSRSAKLPSVPAPEPDIVRFTTTTKKGNTIQFFFNRDTNLLVVDIISANESGGNEIVRQTLKEAALLSHT